MEPAADPGFDGARDAAADPGADVAWGAAADPDADDDDCDASADPDLALVPIDRPQSSGIGHLQIACAFIALHLVQ